VFAVFFGDSAVFGVGIIRDSGYFWFLWYFWIWVLCYFGVFRVILGFCVGWGGFEYLVCLRGILLDFVVFWELWCLG